MTNSDYNDPSDRAIIDKAISQGVLNGKYIDIDGAKPDVMYIFKVNSTSVSYYQVLLPFGGNIGYYSGSFLTGPGFSFVNTLSSENSFNYNVVQFGIRSSGTKLKGQIILKDSSHSVISFTSNFPPPPYVPSGNLGDVTYVVTEGFKEMSKNGALVVLAAIGVAVLFLGGMFLWRKVKSWTSKV